MSAVAEHVEPCASAAAIRSHYDFGNEFYRLWLDRRMVYSCALWHGDEDLETAQLNKLDWHLQHSGLADGGRLLDVGCGWGALLERAVSRFGAAHGVGLTLSEAQARAVRQHAPANVEVRLESWVDHEPQAPYDAIVSIGAFEHFGRPDQTEAQKLERYRSFFRFCHGSLARGGRLSLQTIFSESPTRDFDCFLGNEVYPESDLPHLDEIVKASQGLFEIELLRNDREHYARTLRCWLGALRKHKAEAVALVGADGVAKYERYLGVCVIGFHTGRLNLARIAMRRADGRRAA